jgi:hypothetical protein
MIATHYDDDALIRAGFALDGMKQTMFPDYAARPEARQVALQRFRYSDPLERRSPCVLNQFVQAGMNFRILERPVKIVPQPRSVKWTLKPAARGELSVYILGLCRPELVARFPSIAAHSWDRSAELFFRHDHDIAFAALSGNNQRLAIFGDPVEVAGHAVP